MNELESELRLSLRFFIQSFNFSSRGFQRPQYSVQSIGTCMLLYRSQRLSDILLTPVQVRKNVSLHSCYWKLMSDRGQGFGFGGRIPRMQASCRLTLAPHAERSGLRIKGPHSPFLEWFSKSALSSKPFKPHLTLILTRQILNACNVVIWSIWRWAGRTQSTISSRIGRSNLQSRFPEQLDISALTERQLTIGVNSQDYSTPADAPRPFRTQREGDQRAKQVDAFNKQINILNEGKPSSSKTKPTRKALNDWIG